MFNTINYGNTVNAFMLDLIKGYVFYNKRLQLVVIMTQLFLLMFR